jgi:hypothetical protein
MTPGLISVFNGIVHLIEPWEDAPVESENVDAKVSAILFKPQAEEPLTNHQNTTRKRPD